MRDIRIMLGLILCHAISFAQTIPASEEAKHVGEHATVCRTIAGSHTATRSRGTPTFINLDRPYPDQVFTLLIWGSDRDQVGAVSGPGRICATGVITVFHGSAEIVLRDAHSWYVPK